MWRPPQRLLHRRPEPGWPTVAQARSARWFQPIAIGPTTLRDRTWVPAMVPWRASDDGLVTADVLSWYARFAHGQPGAIVVEATGIRDVPSGPLLRIGHDRYIDGLHRLVDTVHTASHGRTRLFIQLIDFLRIRRRPARDAYLSRFLEIRDHHRERLGGDDDAIRAQLLPLSDEQLAAVLTPRELEALQYGARERVTDTHLAHIHELPRQLPSLFAAAAARAASAGFDGIELHYAHAYTMASFLSALNTRDDGYGATLEQRLRLPLEVLAAVRAASPSTLAVGCRYLTDECIDGGNTVADACRIGVALGAAGIDYLSLSRGGKFDDAAQPAVGAAAYPYTGPSGYECMPTIHSDRRGPFGRNVADTARVRRALRAAGLATPVVVAGGIAGFRQAEEILAHGDADIVAAARQTLADPDWFEKMRCGRGDAIRRCEFTNYCEALDQRHRQVTCKLWDRLDRDATDVPLSNDGERRLVAPAWNPSA